MCFLKFHSKGKRGERGKGKEREGMEGKIVSLATDPEKG